jgi:hypothetical protein
MTCVVDFWSNWRYILSDRSWKGLYVRLLNLWSCQGTWQLPLKLASDITLQEFSRRPSSLHSPIVNLLSLLELLARGSDFTDVPRSPFNCIIYLLLCETNCLSFVLYFLSIKQILSGSKFLSASKQGYV